MLLRFLPSLLLAALLWIAAFAIVQSFRTVGCELTHPGAQVSVSLAGACQVATGASR